MKRSLKLLTLGAATTLALAGFASSEQVRDLCHGFLPENTMQIPVGAKHNVGFRMAGDVKGGLTQDQFNAVIDRAVRLYGPVVAQKGGKLSVNRKWDDPTVNASAQQFGSTWILNMYGGLARHPATTTEGFALVVCHELGHHLGGAPKVSGWYGNDWATNEGGADYFATLKCLRNFWAEDDNESIVGAATIDPLVQTRCNSEFSNHEDQLFCMRSSMAATSVSYLFMDLRKEKTFPKFDTPDTKVVAEMDDSHPGTQCRMDTYFAGAACHVDKSVAQSGTDYREGSCVAPQDAIGTRPLCWFKPD